MGRDGGGSRRGCGFCLCRSQSCHCPGSAGKMLGGLLLWLLLATALCPGLLGTGIAPFLLLLLPECVLCVPAGAPSLVDCSPMALEGGWGGLCWEVVVCAGDGDPGVVVPRLVSLQHVCGVRSAVPVGWWGTGRAFSRGKSGLAWGLSPPLCHHHAPCPCLPLPGRWGAPEVTAHRGPGPPAGSYGWVGLCSADAARWPGAQPRPEPTLRPQPRAPVPWQ